MNLFDPIVVDPSRLHKNFISVLVPFKKAECELVNDWATGFVDRDGKFIEEFQTTFNSSFWEIYLYASFSQYKFAIDFKHVAPDFSLSSNGFEFTVEATTANAAQGKLNEWDRSFSEEEIAVIKSKRFREMNTETIVRLSNAILTKCKKYNDSYKKLPHVAGKPFLLAVAPFEQPHFNLQYDRPIRALLYDHYVDEEVYLADPSKYPNGPPSLKLGYVEKDNGAEIPLGFFNNADLSEISAIIFSCTATWGKVSAMSNNPLTDTEVISLWATPPHGAPERRSSKSHVHNESILDGLHIYHNPYARYPLPPEIFKAPRVVQHYKESKSGDWVYEGRTDSLLFRQVWNYPKK